MLNSKKIVGVELGFQTRCKYACPLLKRLTQQNMHTRVTYRWCIRWAIETFLKQIDKQTEKNIQENTVIKYGEIFFLSLSVFSLDFTSNISILFFVLFHKRTISIKLFLITIGQKEVIFS